MEGYLRGFVLLSLTIVINFQLSSFTIPRDTIQYDILHQQNNRQLLITSELRIFLFLSHERESHSILLFTTQHVDTSISVRCLHVDTSISVRCLHVDTSISVRCLHVDTSISVKCLHVDTSISVRCLHVDTSISVRCLHFYYYH